MKLEEMLLALNHIQKQFSIRKVNAVFKNGYFLFLLLKADPRKELYSLKRIEKAAWRLKSDWPQ